MSNVAFEPDDSVVFLAMCWAGGGPFPLLGLIAVYDWVNHAIPSREELEGALNRLVAAGLVAYDADKFSVPQAAYEAFHAYRRRVRKGRFVVAEAFIRRHSPAEVAPRQIILSEHEYSAAIAEYQRWFNSVLI